MTASLFGQSRRAQIHSLVRSAASPGSCFVVRAQGLTTGEYERRGKHVVVINNPNKSLGIDDPRPGSWIVQWTLTAVCSD